MFAHLLRMHIPGSVISGADVPEFGVSMGDRRTNHAKNIILKDGHDYNIGKISFLMNSPMFDQITFSGFGMRTEYYRNIDEFKSIFSWKDKEKCIRYGAEHIVIHIRLEDVATGIHEDYSPIPISFYKKLIERSGLAPVFIGQFDDSAYCNKIRSEFPNALYPQKYTPEHDFMTIMSSKNIVLSISSFAWLAAYFSDAENIHLPVYGILNPLQRPDVNLLPVWDPRYRFYWLDPRKWTASDADWHHALYNDSQIVSLEVAQMGSLFRKITI